MQAILVCGSRNEHGQTAKAAKAVLEGLAAAGWQWHSYFLPAMKIERCRQCEDDGWGTCRTEGKCVIQDDLAPLVQKIRSADAAVFATPVYFGDLSESIRAFLDRLRRTCVRADYRQGIAGKPALAVCVAGGGGGGSLSCAKSLESVLATCGFDLVDAVPVRRQNLQAKLAVLRQTGAALAACSQSASGRQDS